MIQSIRPKKPREDFPLFPHASGRWCKKVLGRAVYFGKVADDLKGERALNLWLEQRDDLLAGRTPRVAGDGLTVPISSTFFSVSSRTRSRPARLPSGTSTPWLQAPRESSTASRAKR